MLSLASNLAGGIIVNTVNQNMMIPWVKNEALSTFYAELKKIDLHKAGTEEIRDITCCPGSETCNLGITASRGLVRTFKRRNGKWFSSLSRIRPYIN